MLQSLVSTLAPGESDSVENPSEEDVSKLSDKLKQLLGDVDPPAGTVVQRNEKGELQSEEGLPIVEITEPMTEPASGASPGTGPTVETEDTGFVPMYRLPPAERERNRAQMDRILDMLEEEERIEEEQDRARDREELEQRRGNAKAELERVKTAKEMQKKMGKALLKNMADAREKEEKEKERQEREDMEKEEARRSRKPRKIVSWAELPKLERSDDDDAVPNQLPMRPYVVERFPARSGASSPPPPVPMGDSDDESEPPSSDSDSPSGVPSGGIPFPTPEHDQSDGSEDEDEPLESHGSEDGFDIDSIQHQREIALAYFEKRNTIGADAARAMSAHSHDDENDWEEEDVLHDAMLTEPRPKPSQSKFKSERIAQAYFGETQLPSSTPPTSLGTSAVLPNSTSGTLRSALRMGRLESGHLVGNDDSDREDDEDDEAVGVRTREFMEVLRRGDVLNAGAAANSDALIAALETAYGAPPKQPHSSAQAHLTAPPPVSAAPPGTTPPPSKKGSRFKLERAVPPPTIAEDEGLWEGGADTAEHGTTTLSATSRPSPSSAPTRIVSSLPVPDTSASQSPMMIIDSPSFAPPPGGAPMMTTIIDSPSFQKPQFPLPSAKPIRPSSRPPTVLSSVRESSGTPRQQETPAAHEPGKKVSRFKAQRTES